MRLIRLLLLVALWCWLMVADNFAAVLQLRMEPGAGRPSLSADQVLAPGALFIYQATNLATLQSAPEIFFKTNTPSSFLLPVTAAANGGCQAFFFAAHYPLRSIAEFGPSEYVSPPASKVLLLIASGLPASLVAGQAFMVDFFVTDTAGHLLNISGPVQLFTVRQSTGELHSDAWVNPALHQLVGGCLRATISVSATTGLSGYTLSLGPVTNGGATVQILRPVFNLGANPLPVPTAEALQLALASLRAASLDANLSWSCPISPAIGYQVAGTYGEWRGTPNQGVHTGLDLAAAADTSTVASRGGVISCLETDPAFGGNLVIDHGDGWFTRYAGLEPASIAVAMGQVVTRGATLATKLAASADRPSRLHFEFRHGDAQPQWGVNAPGISQDPLQTSGIFAVPSAPHNPQFEEFGLTQQHPGQYPFLKAAPALTVPGGSVYLYVRFSDVASGSSNGLFRLGLRSLSFMADDLSQPVTIQPSNEAAIVQLALPGTAKPMGFAQYGPWHAINPDSLNCYPYWWQWNTAPYASNAAGPRTLTLTGQSYDGTTVTQTCSFGPEIRNGIWEPLGGNGFQATIIAHLGATNSGAQWVQPDQYTLEVLHADHTPMPGVTWNGTEPGGNTKIFTNHLASATYSWYLPAGKSATNMLLRVASRMAPDLRHEANQGVVQRTGRFSNAPALVDIPAGTFLMGSPTTEVSRASWEGPQTTVTLSYCFKIGQYELTQGQYKSLMSNNPSYFSGDTNRPVEQVSWADAMEYCRRLTEVERLAGYLPAGWAYRLPTEAEWEYAGRAGTTNAFYFGAAMRSGMANFYGYYEYASNIGEIYNSSGAFLTRPTAVGSYAPNAWGLYDIHGNVWEWCLDAWSSSLPGGSVTDPRTAPLGADGVIRGGGWYNDAKFCRLAYRLRSPFAYRVNTIGFRVVLAPVTP